MSSASSSPAQGLTCLRAFSSPALGPPRASSSTALGPPRASSPALGPPRASSPALGPPRASSPALGPPRASSPALGPPTASSPALGPLRASSPALGPSRASSPALGPPTASSPALGPPRASSPALGPARASSPALGSPKVSSPALGPPRASSPALGPPRASSPALGPPTASSPALGPPRVSSPALGPPRASSPALGPPRASSQALGPPRAPRASQSIISSPRTSQSIPISRRRNCQPRFKMAANTPWVSVAGIITMLLLLLVLPCTNSSVHLLLPKGDATEGTTTTSSDTDQHHSSLQENDHGRLRRTVVEGEAGEGVQEAVCQPGWWQCWDGLQCVPQNATCSGTFQCGDHSDEQPELCDCLSNEFRCQQQCFDNVSWCDTKADCVSGEDEADCEAWTCPDTHYKCNNGFCVPSDAVCDFVDDCGDNSDEQQCPHKRCFYSEFTCDSGQCIRPGYVCDGVGNCIDGSDEKHCQPEDFVACASGRRVHRKFWCDGWADCADNQADEIHCGECGEDQYRCPNARCILLGNVCDAQCDCLGCEDERNCSRFYSLVSGVAVCEVGEAVRCEVSRGRRHKERCVAEQYVCDGVNHCYNGQQLSDEVKCWKTKRECVWPGQVERWVLCSHDRCIPESRLCDRGGDCPDGQEEDGCPVVTCGQEEWQCSSGQCIPSAQRCDGRKNCNDKSDEHNCWKVTEECSWPRQEEHWFPCSDGRCLYEHLLCDGKVDCLHGEDEHNCTSVQCGEGEWQCGSGQCVLLSQRCDLTFHCSDMSDEFNCSDHQCEPDQAQCRSGQCLPQSHWCDYTIDCFDRSDEDSCENATSCGPEEFRCANGQCIPLEERCVVTPGTRHQGCVDGSHLVDCKGMECQEGMYQCASGECLDPARLCDRRIDCVSTWDDEDGCTFPCPNQGARCRCLDREANCSGLALSQFPYIGENFNRYLFAGNNLSVALDQEPIQRFMERAIYLDLSRNHIRRLRQGPFMELWRLRMLDLRDNHLTSLTRANFYGLTNLRSLHLTGNQITSLAANAFYGLRVLPTLDLSHQGLSHISPKAFFGLQNLTTLSLSHNTLSSLHPDTFRGLPNLKSLDLSHNQIDSLDYKLFRRIPRLKHLVTDEFRLCCQARHVEECLPEADEFSTCEDLMSNLVLRVCIWVLGLTALLGNTIVIIWRSVFSSGDKLHSFLIVNLGLGDLLMGVYLVVVAGVDLHYRGVFAQHQLSWRTSWLCQVAGFLSTFSSELSVFTLTVITVHRLIVIKFPFGVRRRERLVTRLVMAGVWVVVGVLAGLPLANLQYFDNFYGRSGVCLALHITHDKPSGWEYAVFIFLGVNFLSFALIALSYVLMYVSVRDTQKAAARTTRGWDEGMARRMTMIVATDAACWLPIIFLGIASLGGAIIPPKVFSWVAVFVLPLNAAVNPVLYTLSTTPVRKKIIRFRQSVSSWQSRSSSAISAGTWWTSSKKTRRSTQATDVAQPSNADRVTARETVCVYTPGAPHPHEVLTYLHKSPEGDKRTALNNESNPAETPPLK